MEKKPNAANITHGLAQLGGGSKKEGGGGMMAGMQNIFKIGVELGKQHAELGQNVVEPIEFITTEEKDEKKK